LLQHHADTVDGLSGRDLNRVRATRRSGEGHVPCLLDVEVVLAGGEPFEHESAILIGDRFTRRCEGAHTARGGGEQHHTRAGNRCVRAFRRDASGYAPGRGRRWWLAERHGEEQTDAGCHRNLPTILTLDAKSYTNGRSPITRSPTLHRLLGVTTRPPSSP